MADPKTLLVACGSLGLGNATRLLGVLESIRLLGGPPAQLRVVVAAAGPAAAFWREHAVRVGAELLPLEAYVLAPGPEEPRGVPWGSLARPASVGVFLRNSGHLADLARRGRLNLALVDSDYHGLPLLARRVPVIALGQAWEVLRRRTCPPIPARQLWIERLDLGFQRTIARTVLVPSFDPGAAAESRVVPVPLIVRAAFRTPPTAAPAGTWCVLTGGSGVATAPLRAWAERHGVPLLGARAGAVPTLDDTGRPLIDRFGAVVVQGGLSSISECAARRRPMVVVPIPAHGEQASNAQEVLRRGLGLRVAALEEPPARLWERLAGLPPPAPDAWPRTDGAQIVARFLLAALGLGAPCPGAAQCAGAAPG